MSSCFLRVNCSAGCIVQIERNQLYILDHNDQKRQVRPNQVEIKRFNRGTALDVDQNEITKDSVVKVREGPHKGKDGKVLHVYRSFCFLYKREILENSGVFVCRAKHVAVSGSSAKSGSRNGYGVMSVPMSPRIHDGGGRGSDGGRGGGGRGRGGRGKKHEMLYKSVRIISGTEKGENAAVSERHCVSHPPCYQLRWVAEAANCVDRLHWHCEGRNGNARAG